MLLVQCPSCNHENTPGDRFCAVCGVPLDLKPCPACGKVDHVSAQTCSQCGAKFPAIALAYYGVDGDPHSAAGPEPQDNESPASTPVADADKSTAPPKQLVPSRPWPLIAVAVFAGGLPLLWINRASLPLPKVWQIPGPNAASSGMVPSPSPKLAPAIEPASPSATYAAPAAAEPPRAAKPVLPGQKIAAAHKQAVHPTRGSRSQPTIRPDPKDKEEQVAPRTCTEALVALGLCESATAKQ